MLGRAAVDACDGPASSMDSIRADCHCTMARAYHGMGSIHEAYRSYNMVSPRVVYAACVKMPLFLLGDWGLTMDRV